MPHKDLEQRRAYQRTYQKEWQTRQREKMREYQRSYRERHRERILDRRRAAYWADVEESRARNRAKNDPAKAHAYYEANKEHISARNRAYRLAHPAEHKARNRAWFLANRERKQALDRAWRASHKEHLDARRRALQLARKREAWAHYGGARCACCGITDERFLTIDHLHGGGYKHRQEIRRNGEGSNFYRWLQKHNYPEGYRVLCMNCNYAYGHFGSCPHTQPPARTRKPKPK